MAQSEKTDPDVRLKRKYGHTSTTVPFDMQETLPSTAPTAHYQMSNDVRHKINISEWLSKHINDPALDVCLIILILR
jgi:hypothetical protein